MTRSPILLVAVICSFWSAGTAVVEAQTLVSIDDAYVFHDADVRTWSIGNGAITLVAGLASTGGFRVFQIATPGTADVWQLEPATDALFTMAGRSYAFGSAQAGFVLQGFRADEARGGVQLSVTFDLPDRQLRVTRRYAVWPGAPVVEAWTRFEALGDVSTLTNITIWQASVVGSAVQWTSGLRPLDGTAAFTRHRQELRGSRRVMMGAEGRSSESSAPWFVVENGDARLFAGVMWSGAWRALVERTAGGGTLATMTLGDLATAPGRGQSFDTPHAFFGATPGGNASVAAAMRLFIDRGVRAGRPLVPRVTYNTWFAYGTSIAEQSMMEELDHATETGAELFVLDAGWYPGGTRPEDFTTGLGSWTVDSSRFPSGLRVLSAYARERGIRFGIWVEPERVAMSTVGRSGLARERWLAMANGRYDPNVRPENSTAAQICLGDAEARAWVLQRLVGLIEESEADYLKWDNNFWINCDRSGHGHGPGDGNYAHVKGLYEILSAVRVRFPDLTMENCSGGGNRLDVEMLRHTDVGWMDDVSAPSTHVRHNLQGLMDFLPPAYLLSFVMHHDSEPLGNGSDLPLYFRSRMAGVLGMTYIGGEMGFERLAEMGAEARTHATLREILQDAWGAVLTVQTQVTGGPAWDAMQATSASTGDTILFAFQVDRGSDSVRVFPVGLRATSLYAVHSIDAGPLWSVSGAELMENGIEIISGPYSASHVLILHRQELDRPTAPP